MPEIKNFYAVKYGETFITDAMAHQGGDRTIRLPISLTNYLIVTDDKMILVDAGCDTMPGFELNHFYRPVETLARGGIGADKITDVIFTHSHHDHVEAIKHFKNARIYIQESEYNPIKKLISDDTEVHTFKESMNIDGIIDIVHTGGHSCGSSVVEFDYKGKRQALCGDECYYRDCLEKNIITGSTSNPEKSQAFIDRYSNSEKYRVWLSHDPDILPGKNGLLEL